LRFILDDRACDVDWLVVYDEPIETIHTRTPCERRILFITEPHKGYPSDYLKQFGTAISPEALVGFDGIWIQRHGSLSWHFGWNRQNPNWETDSTPFSTLSIADYADKPFELSVICSAKTKSDEHRRRLGFVYALKDLLGDRLHWYGRGVRDMGDKAEAIAPYRYHIVLENNFIDHFWTEKIADSYLGLAFPFYSGCRNLHYYFDAQAFEYIDLDDVPGAAKTIETAIAGRLSETRLVHLREARRKVLFEYNIFNEVNEVRNAVLSFSLALRDFHPFPIRRKSIRLKNLREGKALLLR
jgi:hypothetical protein